MTLGLDLGRRRRIDFKQIALAALPALPALARRWLPDGKRVGREWVARNPRRADRHAGSFSVNLATGKWADFSSGDRGGDAISLCAYLHGLSQLDAARRIGEMIGLDRSRGR